MAANFFKRVSVSDSSYGVISSLVLTELPTQQIRWAVQNSLSWKTIAVLIGKMPSNPRVLAIDPNVVVGSCTKFHFISIQFSQGNLLTFPPTHIHRQICVHLVPRPWSTLRKCSLSFCARRGRALIYGDFSICLSVCLSAYLCGKHISRTKQWTEAISGLFESLSTAVDPDRSSEISDQ